MLYLTGVILAFFLSFVLVTKKNKTTGDYILFAWLAFTGIHLSLFYIYITRPVPLWPLLTALGFPFPLAHGPFLYLYTRHQTTARRFRWSQLLHFIPVVLSYVLFFPFFSLPIAEKQHVFELHGQGFENMILININAIYLSGIVYVSLSLQRLMKYRKSIVNQFSNTERINFNWLLYLILWMVIIWMLVMIVQKDEVTYSSVALFVLWLGYFGIKQVRVFSHRDPPVEEGDREEPEDTEEEISDEPPAIKYSRSSLSEQEAAGIHQRLKNHLADNKPFTNAELTLNDLARGLQVHPNHLSQVINSIENKSFYDLINQCRVEEFIRRTSRPGNRRFSLLGIAYDCGFNSKASFNRNFKKHTGMTPSDYLKKSEEQAA